MSCCLSVGRTPSLHDSRACFSELEATIMRLVAFVKQREACEGVHCGTIM
jgi:hypothetical protein